MQIGQGFIANSFKPAAYVHDDTKEYRMLFKHHDGLNASCLIKPLNESLRMRVTVLLLIYMAQGRHESLIRVRMGEKWI